MFSGQASGRPRELVRRLSSGIPRPPCLRPTSSCSKAAAGPARASGTSRSPSWCRRSVPRHRGSPPARFRRLVSGARWSGLSARRRHGPLPGRSETGRRRPERTIGGPGGGGVRAPDEGARFGQGALIGAEADHPSPVSMTAASFVITMRTMQISAEGGSSPLISS